MTGVGVDQTTLRSRAAHAAWEVPRADPAFNLALLESDAHGGAVIGVDVPEVARPYLGARKAVVHASRAASRDMGASACLAPPRLNDDVLIRPRNVRGRRWPRSRPEDDHNHDDDEREREYACDPEQPRIPARSGRAQWPRLLPVIAVSVEWSPLGAGRGGLGALTRMLGRSRRYSAAVGGARVCEPSEKASIRAAS